MSNLLESLIETRNCLATPAKSEARWTHTLTPLHEFLFQWCITFEPWTLGVSAITNVHQWAGTAGPVQFTSHPPPQQQAAASKHGSIACVSIRLNFRAKGYTTYYYSYLPET
jgi:hypothetical protein